MEGRSLSFGFISSMTERAVDAFEWVLIFLKFRPTLKRTLPARGVPGDPAWLTVQHDPPTSGQRGSQTVRRRTAI